MTTVSAAVPPALRLELERRAAAADRSMSAEVRRALVRYLKNLPTAKDDA